MFVLAGYLSLAQEALETESLESPLLASQP